jgi:hypothetical protein
MVHLRTGWRAICGLALMAALLGAAPAAQAAAGESTHCIAEVSATKAAGGELRCFSTFAEAVNAATDGKAQVAPTLTPQDFNPEALPGAVGQNIVAVAYQHAYYRGATLLLYTTSRGCTGVNRFLYPRLPSGWNDVISSISIYGGCRYARLYQNINFAGRTLLVYSARATLGSFNDITSSIIIF